MAGYDKPDFWAIKAKKEGYPARSVYKLEEMDRKFGLLKAGKAGGPRVLDIGAAPGSWSMWVLRRLATRGKLVAVDIQNLGIAPADPGFTFIKGNIHDPEVRSALLSAGPYDLVVSDAAPATTGNRLVDQGRSEEIVEAVIALALEALAPGGAFAVKIFQGGEEKRLIDSLKPRFANARAFKPEACRAESFETYLVATSFKR